LLKKEGIRFFTTHVRVDINGWETPVDISYKRARRLFGQNTDLAES
jgi:hypothetical protein